MTICSPKTTAVMFNLGSVYNKLVKPASAKAEGSLNCLWLDIPGGQYILLQDLSAREKSES
jgi:hypothetical protein